MRAVLPLAVGETFAWGLLYYSFAALAGRGHDVARGFTVALFASAIASPVVARALTRIGPRAVMIAGACMGCAALLGLSWSRSFAFWILLGIAQSAALYEPGFAAVISWFPNVHARRRALVIVTVFGGLASSFFVPFVNRLASTLEWQPLLVLLAAGVGLVVVPSYAVLPPSERIERRAGESFGDVAAPHRRRLAPIAVMFAMQAFVSTGAVVYLVAELAQAGRSVDSASALAALFGVSQVGGRLLMSAAVDRFSTAVRVIVALLLQSVALVMVQSSLTLVAGLGVATLGAANGSTTIDRPLLIAEVAGDEAFARASASVAMISSLSKAAAPAAVAAGILHFGANHTFSALAGAAGLAAFIFRASIVPSARLWRRARHGC